MEEVGELMNMLRVGQVSSVDINNMTCRVAFDDLDGMVSAPMQIISPGTQKWQHYWLPTEGEHVLCLFQPNAPQEGFVIGSFYTATNLPDDPKEHIWRLKFPDEKLTIQLDTEEKKGFIEFEDTKTKLEIDENKREIRLETQCKVFVEANDDISVKSGTRILLEAPSLFVKAEVKIEGNVSVNGNISASGRITDAAGNTNHHTH